MSRDVIAIYDDLVARHEAASPATLAIIESLAGLLAAGPGTDAVAHARAVLALEQMLQGRASDVGRGAWDLSKLSDAELEEFERLVKMVTLAAADPVPAPFDVRDAELGLLREQLVVLRPQCEALRNEVAWLKRQLEGKPVGSLPEQIESLSDALLAQVRGLRRLLAVARPGLQGNGLERAIQDAADGHVALPRRLTDERDGGLPDGVSEVGGELATPAEVVPLKGADYARARNIHGDGNALYREGSHVPAK
jgi:hypothetical protein